MCRFGPVPSRSRLAAVAAGLRERPVFGGDKRGATCRCRSATVTGYSTYRTTKNNTALSSRMVSVRSLGILVRDTGTLSQAPAERNVLARGHDLKTANSAGPRRGA